MAETSSLLNCRRGNPTGGSNPPLSAKTGYIISDRYTRKLPVCSKSFSGCSVARLARLLWEQEVASSNLATPTINSKPVCESKRAFFNTGTWNLFQPIFIFLGVLSGNLFIKNRINLVFVCIYRHFSLSFA